MAAFDSTLGVALCHIGDIIVGTLSNPLSVVDLTFLNRPLLVRTVFHTRIKLGTYHVPVSTELGSRYGAVLVARNLVDNYFVLL